MDSGIISWCWGTWNRPTWDKIFTSDTPSLSRSSSSSSYLNSSSLLPTSSFVFVCVSESCNERESVWERDTVQQRERQRENKKESADADAGQNRVSLKGIYVWAVQSKLTKQSDHYVWKDTSERVARRCDNTVDKKRVNSSVLKHLFLERVEQPKMLPKNPSNTLSDALLVKFCGRRRTKKVQFFKIALRAITINELIRVDSGPKIRRSCFIHWF